MTGPQSRRGVLPGVLAVLLTLTACGDSRTGPGFASLGRGVAGNYTSEMPASSMNMRLSLGTRHGLTGRYENSSGEVVRFEGTWQGEAFTMFLNFSGQEGLPTELVLDITREKTLTKIVESPFSFQPENKPRFTERNIVRLRGPVVIAGVPLDLNVFRVITNVVSGAGGLGAASVVPRR